MSYASLITSLSQKLTQPTGIAVMASAGIHALVGVALPYLPNSSQENPNSPQPVQLVELTPTELSRVPDLAPPPPLPPSAFSPTPLTSAFPPLPPLNPSSNQPSGSGSSRVDINALVPQRKVAPRKIQDAPKRTDLEQPQVTTAKRLFQPDNPELRIAPHSTVRITPRSSDRFLSPRATGIPRGLQPSTPFPPLGDNAPVNPPVASNRPTNPPIASNPPANSPIASNPPTNPPENSADNNADRGRETAVAPPERTPPENSRTNPNDEYMRNSINALARMGTGEVRAHSRVRGNYPKEACSERLSGTSIITVKVDERGNAVGRAEVSRSSNPIFDSIALSTARGINFAATGQALAYQVPVSFEYDSKVCASSRESPAPEETPNPTPTETPEQDSDSTDTPKQNSTETPDTQNSTETPKQNPTDTPDNQNSVEDN
ncbi:MAG: TonB family protein [Coleofasciculus sp. S288]|nr:TonB family protein [Coleofasciculus sp. S288]